ncbi:MAG TPA: tyrosine-type recombinase/integrase [Dehalococcoidia bacterium]|nr:tyrosine-type recombinase/integrase [Dehalococcoidia bacterium]
MAGSIRKRGNSWHVVVDLGRDPATGKRRQLHRSVRGTRREAEDVKFDLLKQRNNGIDQPAYKLPVSSYLERWLKSYGETRLAPSTLKRYQELVRLHLAPNLQALTLSALRPLHIEECYSRLLAKGLSPRTVLQAHRILRESLHHAVRWQLLGRNPADSVATPRPSRYQVAAVPPQTVIRLLDAAEASPINILIRLAITTGLRQGELLGLRWKDIDLKTGVVHVRQALQWLPGQKASFRQPKTHRSERPVAISKTLIARLNEHRRKQLEGRLLAGPLYQDHDLVFATSVGTPIHPDSLRRSWRAVLKQAGISPLRFHDLRHIHASLLLAQGTHPKVVSERLGHSAIGITMDTYSHTLPNLQREAAELLEQLLEAAVTNR